MEKVAEIASSLAAVPGQVWGDSAQDMAKLLNPTRLQKAQGCEGVFVIYFFNEVQKPVVGFPHRLQRGVDEGRVVFWVSWDPTCRIWVFWHLSVHWGFGVGDLGFWGFGDFGRVVDLGEFFLLD